MPVRVHVRVCLCMHMCPCECGRVCMCMNSGSGCQHLCFKFMSKCVVAQGIRVSGAAFHVCAPVCAFLQEGRPRAELGVGGPGAGGGSEAARRAAPGAVAVPEQAECGLQTLCLYL